MVLLVDEVIVGKVLLEEGEFLCDFGDDLVAVSEDGEDVRGGGGGDGIGVVGETDVECLLTLEY